MSASVAITERAASAVRDGHPWIYREQARPVSDLDNGKWVTIVAGHEMLGVGVWSQDSPLAVRFWSDTPLPFPQLLRERLERAFSLRDALHGDGTTAYRLANGEGDRVPGIVVDRYADVAVLRLDGSAIATHEAMIAKILRELLDPRGITTLVRKPDGHVLYGSLGEQTRVVENRVPLLVDVAHGQKTGAFLDQRENRQRVGAMAKGRSVLNLFSYTGGFSVHAALGGATQTTSVDSAHEAHAMAQACFREAHLDPDAHDFVTSDVFVFLESAKKKKQTWDLIISDPPSFARNERAVRNAVRAYRKLHAACINVLKDGGTFCAASCSSHIDAELFLTTLGDSTLARKLRLQSLHGLPPDHPTLPAWREGRYLKFAVLT